VIQTRQLLSSGFFLLLATVQPLLLTTVACLLFRGGGRTDALLYAAVGSGMLSVWSTTLIGSGQALTLLRAAGLLELLIAAPVPFPLVLAPMTVATASVGLYGIVAALGWGALVFHVPITVRPSGLLALAVVMTALALGLFGLVLASVFVTVPVRQRVDEPVRLPDLAALRNARADRGPCPTGCGRWPGSSPRPGAYGRSASRWSAAGPLLAIGALIVLAGAYLALGVVTIRIFAGLALRRATLALS
jgi:ABC-2 type transport system permease protein